MREKFTDLFASLKAMWQNASRKARVIFLVAAAGILIFCLAVVILLNRVNYVLLFNQYNLSAQESAAVISALQEAGIEPKMETNGNIFVTDKEIDKARMHLAMPSSGLSYDTYNATAGSLTATQFDKEEAKNQQMQDRLQAIIESFDEVTKAAVNINPADTGTFAISTDNAPATASVTITRKPGAQLTRDQVQGIVNMVMHSVAGLTEDNISIIDVESGDLKYFLDGSSGASDITKIELTEQVNTTLENKVMAILGPVYGGENVRVSVSSTLNNDQKVTESLEYTPFLEDNPQYHPESSLEYYREKGGGEDTIAQGVPGATDNVDVPQYGAGDLDIADGDYYVASGSHNYLVGSVHDQIIKEGYVIERISVAVVVNDRVMNATNANEANQIRDLVVAATGAGDEDTVSVQPLGFRDLSNASASEEGQAQPTEDDLIRVLIIAGAGLLALLVIFIVVFMTLQKRRREKAELAAQNMVFGEEGELLVDMPLPEEEEELEGESEDGFEPITLVETPEQKLKAQIKDLADSDPEIVAQLIKTWLVNS